MNETIYTWENDFEVAAAAARVMNESFEDTAMSEDELIETYGHDENSKFVSDVLEAYYSEEEIAEETREDIIKHIGFDDESEIDFTQYEDFISAIREFYLDNAVPQDETEEQGQDQEHLQKFVQEQIAFNSVIESIIELMNHIDKSNLKETMETASDMLEDLLKGTGIKFDRGSIDTVIRLIYDKVYEDFIQ